MHGIINRFTAHPGQRDALAAAMTSDEGPMAGCLHFALQADQAHPDVLWLTEVWETKAHWQASVDRPGVAASIGRAAPLVLDWGTPVETAVLASLRGPSGG